MHHKKGNPKTGLPFFNILFVKRTFAIRFATYLRSNQQHLPYRAVISLIFLISSAENTPSFSLHFQFFPSVEG